MNLKRFLFLDKYDETETEIVCENFDTALMLFCQSFDVLFVVDKITTGTNEDFHFPKVHITGSSFRNED